MPILLALDLSFEIPMAFQLRVDCCRCCCSVPCMRRLPDCRAHPTSSWGILPRVACCSTSMGCNHGVKEYFETRMLRTIVLFALIACCSTNMGCNHGVKEYFETCMLRTRVLCALMNETKLVQTTNANTRSSRLLLSFQQAQQKLGRRRAGLPAVKKVHISPSLQPLYDDG